MAASISYYALVSLFPLLIFLVSLIGFLFQNDSLQKEVVETIIEVVPMISTRSENMITMQIRKIGSMTGHAIGLIGILIMAWSGSRLFGAIRLSINIAYDLEVRPAFVRQKLLDLVMMLGIGLFFVLAIGASLILHTLLGFGEQFDLVRRLADQISSFWRYASVFIPVSSTFVVFLLLYWVMPAKRLRFTDILPGVIVSTVLFEICRVGFAFYLKNFSRYDLVFGSLGAVVIFLLWVYLGSVILLFGAEIASEYPRMRKRD